MDVLKIVRDAIDYSRREYKLHLKCSIAANVAYISEHEASISGNVAYMSGNVVYISALSVVGIVIRTIRVLA